MNSEKLITELRKSIEVIREAVDLCERLQSNNDFLLNAICDLDGAILRLKLENVEFKDGVQKHLELCTSCTTQTPMDYDYDLWLLLKDENP